MGQKYWFAFDLRCHPYSSVLHTNVLHCYVEGALLPVKAWQHNSDIHLQSPILLRLAVCGCWGSITWHLLLKHIKFRFRNTAWLLNWSTVYWHFSLIDRVCMMNCGLCSKMILASSWLSCLLLVLYVIMNAHILNCEVHCLTISSHTVICEVCRGGSHGNCLLIKSISWVTLARAVSSGPSPWPATHLMLLYVCCTSVNCLHDTCPQYNMSTVCVSWMFELFCNDHALLLCILSYPIEARGYRGGSPTTVQVCWFCPLLELEPSSSQAC